MNEIGALYRKIVDRQIPEFDAFLRRRDIMYMGTVIPALLWLLSSNVPDEQLRKGIVALESYMVRRMAVGLSTRGYGDLFIRLTAGLQQDGAQTAGDKVVSYLAGQSAMRTKWPDDSELLDAFVGSPIRQWLTAGRTRDASGGHRGRVAVAPI